MPTLSIVIVSDQGREPLARCLSALEVACRGRDWVVWVVDNASSDGTGTLVREQHPWVQFLPLPEQVGYARAGNAALRRIQTPYVLLLRPETVVGPDVVPFLLDTLASDPRLGGITAKVQFEDGRPDPTCRSGFPRPVALLSELVGLGRLFPRSALFNHCGPGFLPADAVADVACIEGDFLLLKRDVLTQVGLFDEQFARYGEDLDLCRRIGLAGWQLRYEPNVVVTRHIGSRTTVHPRRVIRERHRAWRLLFEKHWAPTTPAWQRHLVHAAIDGHEWWQRLTWRLSRRASFRDQFGA